MVVMGVPSYASLGRRIETHDGARATVRYVGGVDGQDGEWVGVEWDDPGRGKHDGAHDGKRYFECSGAEPGTKPASFLRVHKIKPSVTFATAIRAKYLDGKGAVAMKGGGRNENKNENENDGESSSAYVSSSNGQKIEIELCLKKDDPVAALMELDRVYLPDALVADAGDPGAAAGCGVVAGNIKILDLSGNLFTDWNSIARFGEEFPNICELDLTGVRAFGGITHTISTPTLFTRLTTLLLNKSKCAWSSARLVGKNIPSLTELSVSFCGIDKIDDDTDGLENLDALNLEGNELTSWAEVAKLGKLTKLQRLHLGGNRLDIVRYPAFGGSGSVSDEKINPAPFQNLSGLFLADNKIVDWESIDSLDSFPSLTEVRVSGNPVVESAATRHEIVARVSRLTQLNGSRIADQERKDAEIRYLRRVLGLVKTAVGGDAEGERNDDTGTNTQSRTTPQTGSQAVAALHPRMAALLGSYGALSVSAQKAKGDGTMGDDLISVALTCVAASAGEKAPVTKKLPGSLTVQKLKLLCEKLFKVPVSRQKLFYKQEGAAMPELLEPDDYDVAYLGVRDGARVLVEESDD